MRDGEKINCPHCGEISIAKEKKEMKDFTSWTAFLACSLCGAKVADITLEKAGSNRQQEASLSKLGDIFGETLSDKKEIFASLDEDKQFCKDCCHFVPSPFVMRCALTDKEVKSMDDCASFEKKK